MKSICLAVCRVVMCNNDITALLIIMVRYSYHDCTASSKTTELPLGPTIPHPNKSSSTFKNACIACFYEFWYIN